MYKVTKGMNITIDDKIKNSEMGIYRIDFSNGKFYIGASGELLWRIKTHLRSIRSGFKTKSTCNALKLMVGFDGDVHIYILESIECHRRMYGTPRQVLCRESHYLTLHKDNSDCLNWDMRAYKRKIGLKCVNG